MTAPIPYGEPTTINAGDTAKWYKDLPDHPASAWALTYVLVNAGARLTFAAAADGDLHLVTVPAATTVGWTAGQYAWRAQVSASGEVYTVASGVLTVADAFAAAADGRSPARRTLDALEAALEGRATQDVAELSIGGRAVKHLAITELLALRDRYRAEVAREDAAARAAAGLPARGRVSVRFGP